MTEAPNTAACSAVEADEKKRRIYGFQRPWTGKQMATWVGQVLSNVVRNEGASGRATVSHVLRLRAQLFWAVVGAAGLPSSKLTLVLIQPIVMVISLGLWLFLEVDLTYPRWLGSTVPRSQPPACPCSRPTTLCSLHASAECFRTRSAGQRKATVTCGRRKLLGLIIFASGVYSSALP